MRLRHVIVAAAFMQLAIPTHALFAQDTDKEAATAKVDYKKLYKAALADYSANRNLEASTKFQQVLKQYPDHIHCKRYLSLLRNRIRADAAIPMMKKRLAKLSLNEAEFQDSTLAEVMEYVIGQAKQISKGKINPGLVIHGGDAVRDRKLTFKTGKAPLSSLIDTAAQLTNTKVRYTDHALTFTPLPTAAQLQAVAAKKLELAEAKERAKLAEEEAANDPFLRKR